MTADSAWALPRLLGLSEEIDRLRVALAEWESRCDPELAPIVHHQLSGRAKYFRPVTIFACHRAVHHEPAGDDLIRSAVALEITHNVALIIDDILDRSRFRRQKLSLHCRFGFLPALMTAGYMTSGASAMVADDAFSVARLAELMQRLGVAECLQWRLRRRPLGIEDWRTIAGEDTGSMFEVCACLGTRDDGLRRFGGLLGTLYHGCDDIADVRGTMALGGGVHKDILDRILTLPAAVALRDPSTVVMFERHDPDTVPALTDQLYAALPEAERYLDRIADEARAEALTRARNPDVLLELVEHTRALSAA